MHMLYNSDSFAVVQFEVPTDTDPPPTGASASRGGFEIVDKFARKEIFIDGAMAQSFRDGVEALIDNRPAGPSEEEMDDYIARFASLMHQPVVMH